MSIGNSVSKGELDQQIGDIALGLRRDFRKAQEMRHYLLITPDATLTGIGYTAAEVAIIKSAFADADTIVQAATGAGTITPASNLMVNLDQLAGTIQT